jgi:hypothetical protein
LQIPDSSRRPAGEIKTRALVAAKIFAALEPRRALGQIALALRVKNHLFSLRRYAAASPEIASPLAPEEIEIEQSEKKIE